MADYTINLTDSVNLIEDIKPSLYLLVQDVVAIYETQPPTRTVSMIKSIDDSVSINDEVIPSKTISILVQDSISLIDEMQSKADFLLSLNDNLNANIFLNVYKENSNGDLAVDSTFDCWVVNNNNKAFSRYTDYNFNSFVEHNNNYYASNELGIYKLDIEDEDQFIESKIKTGFISSGMVKFGIAKVFVYQKSNGSINLKITNDNGQEFDYDMIQPNDVLSSSSINPGKGLKGYYFQFEISNNNVSDFEISEINIVPLKSGKKD